MTVSQPLPTVRRRRSLGLLGGLLLGVGVAAWLVLAGAIALGTWSPPVVVAATALAGFSWACWGPVRGGRTTTTPAVPTYNERVQDALAHNEAVIDGRDRRDPGRPIVPGIGPPSAGDHTDWHRHDPGGTSPEGDEGIS